MADRHKIENYKYFDFILDTNQKNNPKMITSKAFFERLLQASKNG